MTKSDPRAMDIVSRRTRGETLASIALDYGLTRERVRQIIVLAGGPDFSTVRASKRTHQEQLDRETIESIRSEMAGGNFELASIAQKLGMSRKELLRVAGPEERRLFVRHVIQPKRWSDDEILGAIEAAGTGSTRLSATEYKAQRDAGAIRGPTLAAIIQRFGSWVTALERVNLVPSRMTSRGRAISEERAVSDLNRFFGRQAKGYGSQDYERWARTNGAASLGTLRNIFGSWSLAKQRALRDQR